MRVQQRLVVFVWRCIQVPLTWSSGSSWSSWSSGSGAEVIQMMAAGMKSVADKLYPAMGNNDYFPNYNISFEPNNDWQQYVASLYAREGVLQGPELETFAKGGFYVTSPRPGLKLLVLNTVVWSQKVLDWSGATKRHVTHHKIIADESLYNGPDAPLPGADTSGWTWDEDAVEKKAFISCDDRPRDPYDQLVWARKELEAARDAKERVIIAGHVPPGDKVGSNNFCLQHLKDLQDLTRDFADIIEVQLYGDHSNDEFRMIWDKNEDGSAEAVSAVLVSAGVTPRKHCNPSWRLFEVSDDHELVDFTQYFLRLADTDIALKMDKKPVMQWKESEEQKWEKLHAEGKDEQVSWKFWQKQYSFREQYGVGLDPDELEALWLQLQKNPKLLRTYLAHMFSQTVGSNDYFDYICDMRYLDASENEECSAKGALLEPPSEAISMSLRSNLQNVQNRAALDPFDHVDFADVSDTEIPRLAALITSLAVNVVLTALLLRSCLQKSRSFSNGYLAMA